MMISSLGYLRVQLIRSLLLSDQYMYESSVNGHATYLKRLRTIHSPDPFHCHAVRQTPFSASMPTAVAKCVRRGRRLVIALRPVRGTSRGHRQRQRIRVRL
jgi:hypothetical protein